MTWGDESSRELPPDWQAIRARVKARAKGQCEWRLPLTGKRCPRPGTDADHKGDRDDHSLRNLRWLCSHHHAQRTAQQGVQSRKGAKKARRRDEPHPNW